MLFYVLGGLSHSIHLLDSLIPVSASIISCKQTERDALVTYDFNN